MQQLAAEGEGTARDRRCDGRIMPAPTLPATPSVRSRVLPALVLVTLLYLALDIGLFSLFSAPGRPVGTSG